MKIFFIKLAQIIAIIIGSFLLTLGYVYGVGYADVYIPKDTLNLSENLNWIVYVIPIFAAYFSARLINPNSQDLLFLKTLIGMSVFLVLSITSVSQLKWMHMYKRYSGFSESAIHINVLNNSDKTIRGVELSFLWKTDTRDSIKVNNDSHLAIYIPKGFEGDYYLTVNFESGKSLKQKIGYASYGPKFKHEIEVYDNKIDVTEKKMVNSKS